MVWFPDCRNPTDVDNIIERVLPTKYWVNSVSQKSELHKVKTTEYITYTEL